MPPERIYEAITTGPMKTMAARLTDDEKRLLAEYMGGRKLDLSDVGDAKNMPNVCPTHPPVKDMNAPAWNGWGDLSNTRFQSAKAAGLTPGEASRLKLKWAFGFPGATALYGQTVVDGRVFVSSNAGYEYSLDAETGCIHWSFHSAAVVRSGHDSGPDENGRNEDRGVLRRYPRQCLRARRIHRRIAVEGSGRHAAAGAHHRQSQALPRPVVRSGSFA